MTDSSPDPEEGYDAELSASDPPQAMRLFNEDTEPDVPLDPDLAAFDRVQEDRTVDADNEREYNRRYVKAHGDHRADGPASTPPASTPGD